MCEELRLQRLEPDCSWGFRLTGGLDFGTPLTVVKVVGGSVAELAGVQVGDIIVEINGQPVKTLTHTEAQNAIVRAGNLLSLNVMRGTIVTPPPTPMRGMTPMHDGNQQYIQGDSNEDYSEDYSFQDPNNNDNMDFDEDHLEQKEHGPSEVVTDLELVELLTGHEEVLDHGVLGINFQKFIPQVDFIRESEVFKMLQKENIKKEIPEEVQLEREPTKRFSTFLQKPKPPPSPGLTGPYWHYPKAPNYLPKGEGEKREQPFRRPKPGHSVLWLFLGESGDHVVDERWGTPDEERLNVSRNTNRDDPGCIMPGFPNRPISTTPDLHSDTDEKTSVIGENRQQIKTTDEAIEEKTNDENQQTTEEITLEENNEIKTEDETKNQEETSKDDKEVSDEKLELKSSFVCQETLRRQQFFEKQLTEIQKQILELEDKAPDLTSQLVAVEDQLTRILDLNRTYVEEESKNGNVKLTVTEKITEKENIEITDEYEREEINEVEVMSESDKNEEDSDSEYTFNIENIEEKPTLEIIGEHGVTIIEGFKKGDFELCEAPPPVEVKKKFHPLTPQARPIVLPGGRQWRKPKDAAHDEFYQGILVEQADVLVGNSANVNFKKYVPPKFDTTQSHVCKLIQEIEAKMNEARKIEEEYYQTPIDKRVFYLATLPQPDPIGAVELRDLDSDIAA